jgi:alpha-glucosidase
MQLRLARARWKNWTVRRLLAAAFRSAALAVATVSALVRPADGIAETPAGAPAGAARRFRFEGGKSVLRVEVLDDETFHFEVFAQKEGAGPSPSPVAGPSSSQDKGAEAPIATTPYISGESLAAFTGPSSIVAKARTLETAKARLTVSRSLCVEIAPKNSQRDAFRICPRDLRKSWKGLSLSLPGAKRAYGLGQQFLQKRFGQFDGDWTGQARFSGLVDDPSGKSDDFGNGFLPYHGGYVGNAQFPALYATGPGDSWLFFLDNVYRQRWGLKGRAWSAQMHGDAARFFVSFKHEPAELRKTLMSLVGRPLVPPKKAFGLWVSEYGFDDWQELEGKLATLREKHFPVDGFVLDLQWFGNIAPKSEDTRMGALEFDLGRFPAPGEKIRELWQKQGVGLIAIEESYVGKKRPEWQYLARAGFLAKKRPGDGLPPLAQEANAFYVDANPWWGKGGMIDWTNPSARDYWHREKRIPLVKLGLMGHWVDLGEPEMYRNREDLAKTPFYFEGRGQADVNNIYNLDWIQGIYEGYKKAGEARRPWILSRSGGPGMQRYGAGMWSGDIGSNMGSMAAHYNAHLHMSMSGIDYYSSDIGGFHREALEPGAGKKGLNELYEQWLANACAFDVPVRPHTENLSNAKETAPDRIGVVASNLGNIRQRYALIPYYYSLAHRAYLYGEPVMPPLFLYAPGAPAVDGIDPSIIGSEKLVGRDLLIAAVARYGQERRDVYLPPGEWADYRSNVRYASESGMIVRGYPLLRRQAERAFELPIFARAGAIIPEMRVDEKTMNALGKRADGKTPTDLRLRIFPARGVASEFFVYEDDGRTTAYQRGEVATTPVRQSWQGNRLRVAIGPAAGSYSYEDPNDGTQKASPSARPLALEISLPPGAAPIARALLNGAPLPSVETVAGFASATGNAWQRDGALLSVKTAELPVGQANELEFFF